MKQRLPRRKKPPNETVGRRRRTRVDAWRDRISIDSNVHHGEPCVSGTRVSVRVIVGSIADGDTFEIVRRAYPQVENEDIRACLRFAAEAVTTFDYIPFGD